MKDFTKQAISKLDGNVFAVSVFTGYPVDAFFHPSEHYPEYPFPKHVASETKKKRDI